MRQDIVFTLRGSVNGYDFEMNGTGAGDASEGTCELNLKAGPSFPTGFDPVSCPLICSHPTSSFFAREIVPGESLAAVSGNSYRVEPAREGILRDNAGQELLRLQVTGSTSVGATGKLVSENVMLGMSKLPAMEKNITPLRDYILPSGLGEATAIVRYKMLTRSGEELDGQTVIPYRWDGGRQLETPLVRLVESIDVHWDGRLTVSAFYRVSIAPVTELTAGRLIQPTMRIAA